METQINWLSFFELAYSTNSKGCSQSPQIIWSSSFPHTLLPQGQEYLFLEVLVLGASPSLVLAPASRPPVNVGVVCPLRIFSKVRTQN